MPFALMSPEMKMKVCSESCDDPDDIKVCGCPSHLDKFSDGGAQNAEASTFYAWRVFAFCRRIAVPNRPTAPPCKTPSMRLFNNRSNRAAFLVYPSQSPNKDKSFSPEGTGGQT